ncbi:MAG: prolipoprotein diacylglyceryl transferase [Dehalococcoidia bacterium]|nr:prolipoprotein diacylglyceryl transferase [Dehalococcoidia bacterium]
MIIDIDPVVVKIGFFTLRWYSLLVMAAVIAGVWLAQREARRQDLSADSLLTLTLWAIPGGIIGSRLVHVIDQADFYLANPRAIIGGEGQAIYGAILGGALAVWIGSKVHKLPIFPRMTDVVAPGIPLAHSIGRLANVVNGDATGAATSVPWAFVYTNPNTYGPIGVSTHPSVVYEIMWNLVIVAILHRFKGRLKPDGFLFILYLALYASGRFFINFSRVNDTFFLGLHQAQVIALLVVVVTVPLLAARGKLLPRVPAGEGKREVGA